MRRQGYKIEHKMGLKTKHDKKTTFVRRLGCIIEHKILSKWAQKQTMTNLQRISGKLMID